MDVYFAPLACSMATRITLYEAGASANFIAVDTKKKRVADGSDFYAINPMGQVPALRTDAGELLTENPVVLQYVADLFPQSGLAPEGGIPRYRLQQWLNFISTELHKQVFIPLLDAASNDGARAFACDKAPLRLRTLNTQIGGREHLLDNFTVADAYLVTVLNWGRFSGIDLAPYPAVHAYFQSHTARPSVARAMEEELALFQAERARQSMA